MSKGIVLPVVLAVVAISAIASGVITYFHLKSKPSEAQPSPSPVSTLIPTSSSFPKVSPRASTIPVVNPSPDTTTKSTFWTKYRNIEYSYEVNYLGDWELVEAKPRVGNKVEWSGDILEDDEIQKVTFLEKTQGAWPGSFEIRILSNPEKLSIKSWWEKELKESNEWQLNCLKENPSCPSLEDVLRDQEEIIFNNQTAIKTSIFSYDSNHICVMTEKGHIFTLCYYDAEGNDVNYTTHNEIYNQMLATFKFLD